MYALSFLVVALSIFNACLVSARPEWGRRSPAPVAEGLTTNARRFAAGLTPIAPVRRWIESKVDCASRQLDAPSYYNCFFRSCEAVGSIFDTFDTVCFSSIYFHALFLRSSPYAAELEKSKSTTLKARGLVGFPTISFKDSK